MLGAHSLLTLDGEEHMRQRKLLLPPFHGERVRGYAELVAEIAGREVESWPLGRPFALRESMQRITLEVILRAVFGVREEERLRRFRALLPPLGEVSTLLLFSPWMQRDLGPRSPWGRFLRDRAAVDALIYEEIALRREAADLSQSDDVLSLLLQARDEDGRAMSDVELRDELMTLLTAGHETTATGLSWAFERLVRTPDVMARTVECLSEDDGDAYLEAVVKETLRIRPVIVDVARKVSVDWEVEGYDVPAGTLVMPAIAAIHRRPDLWERPLELRPERFLSGEVEPYSWIPFGGGVRRCIGAAFALMEMRVVLRAVLERMEVRRAGGAGARAAQARDGGAGTGGRGGGGEPPPLPDRPHPVRPEKPPSHGSQTFVGREQDRIAQPFGEGEVSRVVGAELIAEIPHPRPQQLVRVADQPEVSEVGDRLGRSPCGDPPAERQLAQHVERLRFDDLGRMQRLVPSRGERSLDCLTRLLAVEQVVGEHARVDDDQRESRSSRIRAAAEGPS